MHDNGGPTVPLSEYEGYDWDEIEGAPSADTLFRILSDVRRRRVLWYLLERPESTVEELADVLAGWRAGEEEFVDPEERGNLLVSLHHLHLPALAEGGLVRYDADAGTVALPPLPYPVEVVIKFSYQYERAVGVER